VFRRLYRNRNDSAQPCRRSMSFQV
jgi:hypothetical protein